MSREHFQAGSYKAGGAGSFQSLYPVCMFVER